MRKNLCSYGAIRGGVTGIKVRDIDSRNVKMLGELEGITILDQPQKILELIDAMQKLKY